MSPASAASDELDVNALLEVLLALKAGDFTARLPAHWTGVPGKIADTLNEVMVSSQQLVGQLEHVGTVVGKEGRTNQRVSDGGTSGGWSQAAEAVNELIEDLVRPHNEISRVIVAAASGDLSQTVPLQVDGVPLQGQFARTARTVNTMVGQLNSFAGEVTRVAREVGTEGKLGGQAQVTDVGGVWRDLTESVNTMASNLTAQVRNIAEVMAAAANGDLSKKITVEGRGEILELKNTINVMVDQLNSFAGEVTRVAREVGTEGKLGGQAQVTDVGGVWKDLTESVNFMAANLTSQVRNIADVTTAVANGDLSRKVTVDVQGEILELKNTINQMVDQLNSFAGEVTRVAREVGTEGKLGGQAQVTGVSGTWRDLTDNVNLMAANLTGQVRNIADVTTAVANGDLSKKVTVDVQGEILEVKNTINQMVDQLNSFAGEVTRVAREVGTEGRLGGQAQVTDVGGVWKDLTENVNFMAANLTSQVRNIAEVTTAVANGDLSRKITVEGRGEILELKNTINEMVEQLSSFSAEVTRVAREVGTEGKLGGQAQVRGVSGTWRDLTDNVNLMAANLTGQVRNIADVTTAVATGDLSRKVTVDVQGEILELKNTINQMVDQLNSFAGEVTRVAREVGTEGKLGGQAQVSGVSGTWRDLTDNVNQMADNLTEQVRGIARVVTAVANGDLKRKLSVEAKGEVAALGETLNEMTETLATFADQVITVAREVGVEGRLGGQASVPGAAGRWKDLTDNVNQLAATLTNQIRAIADVSTAVTGGDLTRSIGVEAFGEVAVVKDKINEMIRALRETNQRNQDQDWLKTNLARFTGLLQGQRDLQAVSRLILSELAPQVGARHGVFYTLDNSDPEEPSLRFQAGYAYRERKNLATVIRVGEGLVGQCALEKERILLTNVPHDYITISSGLGEAAPLNIVVLPILFEGQIRAVVELASFERFSPIHLDYLDQLTESIGIVLNTIEANMRTEGLLKQSQSLAGELQHQQEELRQTNEELEQKAAQLAQQNDEVERKNREVEQARASLEEKAEQLDITSRYKSEFLANMSHELRTPLNSMLILSEQLAENQDGTLTQRQIEFANIINSSGRDLLELINDVLDLTKIEAGQISVEVGEIRFRDLQERLELAFRHVAESKGLGFVVEGAPELPRRLRTDAQRLEQILKNLLSNAFKFTREGQVELRMRVATSGWGPGGHELDLAPTVVAFDVIDSGVGIAPEKQRIIFEAFQQADGTTSRSYGGTGLGLSISRELVRLLGGQITLQSEEGRGSRFTVYLPLDAPAAGAVAAASPSDELAPERSLPELRVVDDRERLRPGEPVLLIVEDDANFSRILLDLAHQKGFTVVVARDGNEVLDLAKRYRPSAITLDLGLRDISGWNVLEGLRSDPETKDIPVHVVSVFEDARERVQAQGATSFVSKPASAEHLDQLFARIARIARSGVGTMLVVEPEALRAQEIVEAAGRAGISAQHAESGQRALELLRREAPGCVLLNLMPGDMSGLEFLRRMRRNPRLRDLPVVVTGQEDLSRRDRSSLGMVQSVILQDAAGTPEQLVANVERVLGTRNGDQQSWLTAEDRAGEVHATSGAAKAAPGTEEVADAAEAAGGGSLAGRHILVVDDDIRNLYALKSLLESSGASVDTAESGAEAMTMLQRAPGTELVLLDIMMPGKDGFQVLREIRAIPAFRTLPVIAVTAKAMKGDREELLEAGATDYVAKPVRSAKLLETVRAALRGAANP